MKRFLIVAKPATVENYTKITKTNGRRLNERTIDANIGIFLTKTARLYEAFKSVI